MAVIEVMEQHSLDSHGVPVVVENTKDKAYRKIAVCDVTDIVECVGLVQYSATKSKFKVVWPKAQFHKKLDRKLCGQTTDY